MFSVEKGTFKGEARFSGSVNHLELEFSADDGYRTEVFNSVVNKEKLMNLSCSLKNKKKIGIMYCSCAITYNYFMT